MYKNVQAIHHSDITMILGSVVTTKNLGVNPGDQQLNSFRFYEKTSNKIWFPESTSNI
jgi:hypothetical protein